MTTYCTQNDLEKKFSQVGVEAFSDHEETTGDVVADSIEQASGEIDLYCRGRYSVATLSASALITRWCTVLACCMLCECRGNPVPESLAKEAERIYKLLQMILDGKMNLENTQRPGFSNLTIDRRYRRSQQRRIPTTSSNDNAPVRHNADEFIVDPR